MGDKLKKIMLLIGPDDGRMFWIVLAVGVVLSVIGIMLGNPFEDYQTSSTL
ncbi:MAG: hypothetical protein HQL20_03515 [Candidatus Omnitrophica bacterium]|nr:hypothetical protein [Candidatus Omnitrophota bacterium]